MRRWLESRAVVEKMGDIVLVIKPLMPFVRILLYYIVSVSKRALNGCDKVKTLLGKWVLQNKST